MLGALDFRGNDLEMAETNQVIPELLPSKRATYLYRTGGSDSRVVYLDESEVAVTVALADFVGGVMDEETETAVRVNKSTHTVRDIPASELPELRKACANNPTIGEWRVVVIEPMNTRQGDGRIGTGA